MKRIILATSLSLFCGLAVNAQTANASASGEVSNQTSSATNAGNKSISLDSGTRLAGELQSTIDARKAKVGDQVVLRTTQAIKSQGRTVVSKGSRLIGHVTEVTQQSESNGESRVGLLFDRLEGGAGVVGLIKAALAQKQRERETLKQRLLTILHQVRGEYERPLAMHWQRHKVGAAHWREMAEKGERMPVVIALGGDPASIYSGSAPLPPTMVAIEIGREAATLVMLAMIGMLAGRTWRGRLGYAAIAFGAFTPSLGTGLYHVADEQVAPGIKLWSYGVGEDRAWAMLSTAERTPSAPTITARSTVSEIFSAISSAGTKPKPRIATRSRGRPLNPTHTSH